MTKTAKNQKIINAAQKIAMAIEAETEEILNESENLIKSYFPARYAKAALVKVEEGLDQNGLQVEFKKEISPALRRKTASVQASGREMHEAIAKVVDATVGEMEDMLADANEVANRVLTRFAASERPEVEAKLKNLIENRMRNIGIFCQFDRVTYDPSKVARKAITAAMKSQTKTASHKGKNRILAAMERDAKKM